MLKTSLGEPCALGKTEDVALLLGTDMIHGMESGSKQCT